MNRKYFSPALKITFIEAQNLLAESIKVGGSNEKVSNSSDIGFVKGNSSPNNHNVWNDDWSSN